MRWLALISGVALIALAIAAVTRVSDTREGLIAEVITLLGAAAGISLLIYGLAARRRPAAPAPAPATSLRPPTGTRSVRDLRLGAAGIGLAAILFSGLAVSGGFLWATLGLALMLPMIAGSAYLCFRYWRARP